MKKVYFLVPVFLIALSTILLIFNTDFYEEKVPEYDQYAVEVDNLLKFYAGNELNEESFSEIEVIHLHDVRKLIQTLIFFTLFLGLIIFFGLRKGPLHTVKKNMIYGGVLSFAFVLILPLLFFIFDSAFILFHKVLFRNDYWLLPPDSILIQMFPQSFFMSSFEYILLYSLTFSLLVTIIGIYIPGDSKDGRSKDGRK